MRFNRTKKLVPFCPLIVAVGAFIYAIGDYLEWWDKLFGRHLALQGVQDLSTTSGFPDIIVFDDEPEFPALLRIISEWTSNEEVSEREKVGESPNAIGRVGGTITPYVGDKLPNDWPNPSFAPESAPIFFAYNYKGSGNLAGSNTVPVGRLGDVRNWISEERDRERFWVSTFGISALSILLLVIELKRSKTESKQGKVP